MFIGFQDEKYINVLKFLFKYTKKKKKMISYKQQKLNSGTVCS
jgi:hypothetical protein